jgi:hypothetical protein
LLENDLIRGDISEKSFKCIICSKVPIAPISECQNCEEIYCGICTSEESTKIEKCKGCEKIPL